jgi:hypothetical protein
MRAAPATRRRPRARVQVAAAADRGARLLRRGCVAAAARLPVVGIAWFLRLQWAIEGQVDLFPGRRFPLLDGWAAEAATGIG